MIEARGIATTVIGLVRPHLEKARPPRALFVPFQLGRPLGEPGDANFQNNILRRALGLLERTDGPVILADFDGDPPGWHEVAGWRPGFHLQVPVPAIGSRPGEWAEALREELRQLEPRHERATARRGRTTVGLSRLSVTEWPAFVAAFLGGELPVPPAGLSTSALALRFLCDDMKAYYGEAAQLQPPHPASRQLDQWFWRETVAGGVLQELRRVGMASENNALRTVAGRFFVPAPYVVP